MNYFDTVNLFLTFLTKKNITQWARKQAVFTEILDCSVTSSTVKVSMLCPLKLFYRAFEATDTPSARSITYTSFV